MEKRSRTSSSWADKGKNAAGDNGDHRGDPIDYWRREGNWPKKYFEQGDQTWLEELEANKSAEEHQQQEEWYKKQAANMENSAYPVLIRKRSSASLRRQNSELGIQSSTDLPREEKSAKYRKPEYEEELKDKGKSHMCESDLDITDESNKLCRSLLNSTQSITQNSIFRDDLFRKACEKIQNRNEARVIQDITRLIVPSAETLATCGATGLKHLIESVNEGWNKVIPITDTRPQPDYSVGFQESAFTDEQLQKLKVLVGGTAELSCFMATWRMFFPFLTCEVKCGAVALDIADRQNAHSMTCAVKAIVELYRYVKWDEEFDWRKELNREILGFSISHDDKCVRIYGHYPVLDGDKTAFYRHPIHIFGFRVLDGKEKWTAYKFTKNVYENWMPKHLKRITKAIDAIPAGLNFGVSSASFDLTPAVNTEAETGSQEMSQSALSSQDMERPKKPRLKPTAMLQQEIDWLREERKERKEENQKLMQQLFQEREERKEENQKLMQQLAREREEHKEENQKLMQQLAREREEHKEENQKLMQQLAQEKEEHKEQHTELMDLLKEQTRSLYRS